MITNVEKWHYIDLKSVRTDDGLNRPIRSLPRFFRRITENHHGYFYCLNCLNSFRTDNALKRHERLRDCNDYCNVEMPTQGNNTIKYNNGGKSMHEPCGYALSLISSFDSKENKQNFYRGKDCIKRFCSNLKELATKIIDYEEKEMIPLTDKENKFYKEQEKCHICQKEFCYDKNEKKEFKYTKKLEIIVIIEENLEELLVAFAI